MAAGLTAERVRQDVDVVARAGLELETFLAEATESVRRAVPWVSACVGTHDPTTHMLTSARKYGHLQGRDAHDHEFGLIEYGTVEQTAFTELARAATPAAGVHLVTDGEVHRSTRMARFMMPRFGFGDEARLVFRDGREIWGAMALFRGPDDRPFDAAETEFLASLAAPFARGVRAGLLTRIADVVAPVPGAGPAVIIVGPDDEITQMTPAAEQWIAELADSPAHGDPLCPVAALVGAARRYARGETPVPPRCRLRTTHGMWLVLQAGPLSAFRDREGDVVVTIEEARPPEIVALVVAAFGLTPRERDVTQLVLQGIDTKEIATTLHLSAYTVQDHLKSVFDKAGVRSRRELVSRVYFDQYVPRMGTELSPSGWFATEDA
ncbi:response regulator transcription factor [Nocardia thailandica]|uniref:Response regulator transcription factor n=1 Tax=Nocardia thailandica TaxID=257275 RepID=A0ABW6PUA4_9NOCA|nr:helix-turn-helix transcriptional regulator [Nocardia thailandica]